MSAQSNESGTEVTMQNCMAGLRFAAIAEWVFMAQTACHERHTHPTHRPDPGRQRPLGLAAAQAFHAAGWQVVAALRGEPAPGMPKGVHVVHTPVQQTEQLAREAIGAHAVVHALNPPYTRWHSELLPLAHAGMDVARAWGARLYLRSRHNLRRRHAGLPA